ncbi:MAG: AI-2E family transporter [Bacteroidetes bacterium]|nr:AI-2E family transporter [Bacteroidota bacterium]MBU1678245.1 AI-2E family transporter [Bacteroidota bacterium]
MKIQKRWLMIRLDKERLKRSRVFYFLLTVFIIAVIGFLIYSMKSLILPTIIGALIAYICIPILDSLKRKGLSTAPSVLVILGSLFLIVFFSGKQIVQVIPDEKDQYELRVELRYKLNEMFLDIMEKETFGSEGNLLSSLVGEELYPVVEKINQFLSLSKPERNYLYEFNFENPSDSVRKEIFTYLKELDKLPFAEKISTTNQNILTEKGHELDFPDTKATIFLDAVSTWIVLPFVFIFLLIDDGRIKRFIISLVPNRYFEMALTTFDNVDDAIGNYLRGTLLQSSLVGLTFIVGLVLIGFKVDASILIGLVAGISNAIPFLGPVIGLGVGLTYALIADNVTPLIPFMGSEDVVIGVFIVVLIAQGLDNSIFQPLVLGKAVDLHPLIVILGVTGGSIIYGFIGMLFAIPTIVIIKVIISTFYKQLKAYYIIY